MNRLIRTSLDLMLITLLAAGCATYPDRITTEIKQTVKTVTIANEVRGPSSVQINHLPRSQPVAPLQGVLVGVIDDKKTQAFGKDIGSQINVQNYLSQTFLSAFKAKLASCAIFVMTTNPVADAVFILEVKHAELGPLAQWPPWPFPGWGRRPALVTVAISLISKPPLDLVWDKYGNLALKDLTEHKILFQSVVTGSPTSREYWYNDKDFRNKDIFLKAFANSISNAVDVITKDW